MIPHPLPDPAPGLGSLLVLAVVQGLSEFLPISSSGHLTLAQALMHFEGPNLAVDIALHLGTLGAVLVVFWRDVLGLLADLAKGRWGGLWLIVLGSIPAAVVGLGFKSALEPLFTSGRAASIGLLFTSAVLWTAESARRRMRAPGRAIDWRDALWIGSMQALAILPGISRSGSTIGTALVRKNDPTQAARYSFLLSVPAVAGAVLLELPELARSGEFSADLVIAVIVSFAVGVLALRLLLAFLGRGAFRWCAIYCTLLGLLGIVLTSS